VQAEADKIGFRELYRSSHEINLSEFPHDVELEVPLIDDRWSFNGNDKLQGREWIRSLMPGPPYLSTKCAQALIDADVLAEVSFLEVDLLQACYRIRCLMPDYPYLNSKCAQALTGNWDVGDFIEFGAQVFFYFQLPGQGHGSNSHAFAYLFMKNVCEEPDASFLTSWPYWAHHNPSSEAA
jgi:hypothetical protein